MLRVHMHHIMVYGFSYGKRRALKKLCSSSERKQTLSTYLITHAECFHKECCSLLNHLMGGWFMITFPQMKRGRGIICSAHMITQLVSGHEECWPLSFVLKASASCCKYYMDQLLLFWLCFPFPWDDLQENRDAILDEFKLKNRIHFCWELPY